MLWTWLLKKSRSTRTQSARCVVTMKIDQTIDIKGEVCPMTFVKTKLVLEEMKSGEILEVITDHKPAFMRMPESCEYEGHSVLKKEQVNDTDYRLIIQKK